jgi:hypothetical protein
MMFCSFFSQSKIFLLLLLFCALKEKKLQMMRDIFFFLSYIL